jgi:hypothetical protein
VSQEPEHVTHMTHVTRGMSWCRWQALPHLQDPEGRPRLYFDQKVLVHWVGGVVHPLMVVHHTQQVVVIGQPCGCMYGMAWCIDTGEQTATSITLWGTGATSWLQQRTHCARCGGALLQSAAKLHCVGS